jgi:hypothetical protein
MHGANQPATIPATTKQQFKCFFIIPPGLSED